VISMDNAGRQSPVFVKTRDFVCWLIAHTIKFPKSQRFVMARHVEDAALDFQERLIRAAMMGGTPMSLTRRPDSVCQRYGIRLSAQSPSSGGSPCPLPFPLLESNSP